MTTDDLGRVWFVETGPQPNLLQGFDPASGKFLPATAIPSGGRSVRHMVFDPNTRSLWFGTDTNRLARARVPRGLCGPADRGIVATSIRTRIPE